MSVMRWWPVWMLVVTVACATDTTLAPPDPIPAASDPGLASEHDASQRPDPVAEPEPAGPEGGAASPAKPELEEAPALDEPCGAMPSGPEAPMTAVYRPSAAGCGLALGGVESIVRVEVVSLELGDKESRVGVVFLDAHSRRVLPIGQMVRWEMEFKRRARGRAKLAAEQHTDGIFWFSLPRNARAAPCKSHVFVRIKVNGKDVEAWLDDWLYGC